MTRTSSVIMIADQTGYADRNVMFTIALTIAMITPMVRAQILPVKSAMPAPAMTRPPMMWTQPHVV